LAVLVMTGRVIFEVSVIGTAIFVSATIVVVERGGVTIGFVTGAVITGASATTVAAESGNDVDGGVVAIAGRVGVGNVSLFSSIGTCLTGAGVFTVRCCTPVLLMTGFFATVSSLGLV